MWKYAFSSSGISGRAMYMSESSNGLLDSGNQKYIAVEMIATMIVVTNNAVKQPAIRRGDLRLPITYLSKLNSDWRCRS